MTNKQNPLTQLHDHTQSHGALPSELPIASTELILPSNFQLSLSRETQAKALQNLSTHDFLSMPTSDIVMLGGETERSLHRILDGFLAKIEQHNDPKIFKLLTSLKTEVSKEDLPSLVERIINPQPTLLNKLAGIFNKKALATALSDAWEETRRIAMGKTKTLVDVVQKMEVELQQEKDKLSLEIKSLEQLKDAYRGKYDDFVGEVVFLNTFLARAREAVKHAASTPQATADQLELQDKLQALESRALAMEGTLTRLPTDQLVIRQIQNAAIATLQETTTTAAARFGSIKMTLLTIHGSLLTQSVQQFAQHGAALDENLLNVRSVLLKQVVSQAAHAPGDNRLMQAQQLKSIVAETAGLVELVEASRARNQEKFEQARVLFAQARTDILAIGLKLRPDQIIKQ
jgi:uncharacterized protein YaaN involved in tellurite resistance